MVAVFYRKCFSPFCRIVSYYQDISGIDGCSLRISIVTCSKGFALIEVTNSALGGFDRDFLEAHMSPLFNIFLLTDPVEPLLYFTERLLDSRMTSSAIVMQ